MDIERLKKMINQSISLSDDEKKIFIAILPIIRDEDLLYLRRILQTEQSALAQLPGIARGIKTTLESMFSDTLKVSKKFKKSFLSGYESAEKERNLKAIEESIDNLN
jgi:hypothetical protein